MPRPADQLAEMLRVQQFPLSASYDAEWVIKNEMGPNVLWLTEALCQVMAIRPDMRVLDMGCGRAMSSIFLAKECGCQVWATDLWVKASDNWQRIREAGVQDRVFPIHAEARALPYADEFFDAVVSLDSYHFFGTDVEYLERHMLKLLKRGGQIGIVTPASPQQIPQPMPEHLEDWLYFMNSIEWWRHHWERYPEIEVELAEELPGGWRLWLQWEEALDAAKPERAGSDAAMLRTDAGRYLGFVRMLGRRREKDNESTG
jgi:SAM-dependent methyltransferase